MALTQTLQPPLQEPHHYQPDLPQAMFQLRHSILRAVDMGSQVHVVLKVFEVVTHELCDDSILFLDLLLEGAELLLQGLNTTKLFGLHDHHIVRAVHHVVQLEDQIS